jgi:cytochrome c6
MLIAHRRLGTLAIVIALVGGVYLSDQTGDARPTALQEAGTPEAAALVVLGEDIYNTTCIACHQPGGVGVEGYYPMLAANPFVTLDDPIPAIQTVLQGRGGMPSFDGLYSDEEIASVLTYVRQAWGNTAGPVSPEAVADVRAEVDVDPAPFIIESPHLDEATPTDPSG